MVKTIRLSPLLVKYFALPYLGEFDLTCSLSTMNKWAEPMRVYYSLFQDGQKLLQGIDSHRTLQPWEMLVVTGEQVLAAAQRDLQIKTTKNLMALVHLVPVSWTQQDWNLLEERNLPLEECREYCYKTDGYSSYAASGQEKMTVGYHCLWWNLSQGRPQSTLFQGCKFPYRPGQETYVLLTNFSSQWSWQKTLTGKVFLTDARGAALEEQSFSVKPFSYSLIPLGRNLDPAGQAGYLNIVGTSPEGQLLPFFISRNTQENSYFIEHGVGPDGYFFGVDTAFKQKSAEFIFRRPWKQSDQFKGV